MGRLGSMEEEEEKEVKWCFSIREEHDKFARIGESSALEIGRAHV